MAEQRKRKIRGGHGGGLFGVIEEVFAPTRHEAVIELERQAVLPVPAHSPDRDFHDEDAASARFAGKITLDVPN
jgi:hypothetical protein